MLKNLLSLVLLFFCVNTYSQSFNSIWNTANIESGSSADNQITIPTNPAFTTYNYDVEWGDGTSDTGVTGNITHDYAAPGIYTIEISGTFPSIYFNDENANDKLKIIEILAWGAIQWQTMENAFYGCENLNFDAIDAPDFSQVTTLQNMFRDCSNFNGIVNNWDVSTITNMAGLFRNARIFNRPLDLWNTSAVTDMSETFYSAGVFNEPLDNWNTGAVTNMSGMFRSANSFNQNINNWNVGQVTNMSSTFANAGSFNFPLNNWNVSNVTDMSNMFDNTDFNQPIGNWNVSNVTNMSRMFSQALFNQPIGNWNVSSVTDISEMFQRNRTFDQPLNTWDVSNVTNMSSVFDGWIWGAVYNQPLNLWNVSNVTDMSNMFRDNSAFNQDISGWDVSNVTNMQGMFNDAAVFNQNINGWNVSNVTNMASMFQETEAFDQPLNGWSVDNVTNVSGMFARTTAFNRPLDAWNLSNVSSFQNMFNQAIAFNQDIGGLSHPGITNMSNMFNQATSFDQDMASWNISGVTNMIDMLSNSGLSQENYDNTLIGWESQNVQDNVDLVAINLTYCDGRDARQRLIDDHNWSITGDAVNCTFVLCTEITSPLNTDTMVPANSDIRWAPAPNATGYNVTLEVERAGVRDFVLFNGDVANDLDVGNVVGLSFTNEFSPGDLIFVTVVPYNNEGPATGCAETSFTVIESWVNSPDAFKLTYDTSIITTQTFTPANGLRIETSPGLTYNYSIDWGDGQYNNNVSADITHTYLTPGIYTVSIIGTYPAPRHEEFNSDSDKLLTIDQWGTQVWESMSGAFAGCENMEYNATDIPNLSNVTDMSRMFIVCQNFNGTINNWDVSNVTNMNGLFGVASIFNQPLNNWDVSNVTNMNFMFASASEFNQNIDNWNTSNVTDMGRMFRFASAFNQPLNSWNVSNVLSMDEMFDSTDFFDQPLDNWNVSSVTDMESMFEDAIAFNQNINVWDVSSVTLMESMFEDAVTFNRHLNSWNVSSVTAMNSMFEGAAMFDRPLNNWDVSSVTNMQSMFQEASSFNQNINSWNVTNVTTMSSMFDRALVFNEPLNDWEVNSVVNMSSMFRQAAVFNQPLNNWDVSAVANTTSMFEDAIVFDQPINTWDVSSVTLMESMFENAAVFNQDLNNWNVASVTNMASMFQEAQSFNFDLGSWDTGEVLTMEEMFFGATVFNQNIDSWDVSFVRNMESMFESASNFNMDLDAWNVASVTTMESMFENAAVFNGTIGTWNVRGVTTMESMFDEATAFNQNINDWRVSGVSNMNSMFNQASAYNQPMDLWNLGNVSMRSTFNNATSLNQSLEEWNVSGVTDMRDMLDNTALIRENYDNTLIAWSEQTLNSGITLGAQGLPYCDAQEERQSMIDTFGWTFSLDVRDCPIPECTQLASPLNGDTDVPVNTNITWGPALFAQGYRLTVGTTSGGNDIVNNETITNETSYEFAADFNTGDIVYVTLIPFNDEGDAVGPCTEESFTISNDPATIPDCTNLNQPLDGANDVVVTTDLSWDPISNADGYRLTVGTSAGGNDLVDDEDVGNTTTYEFSADLPEDAEIFVTITPYNNEGDATACSEESFDTELIPVPPVCTNLTSPANNATDVPIDTNLSWTPVANATGYLVIVGTTSGGIEVANNVDVGLNTTYDITDDLQEGRLHFVTIIPYNDEGDATACIEETFTTGSSTSPPSCVSLITPLNGATDVALDTNLSWNSSGTADGYNLRVGTTMGGSEIFDGDVGDVTTFDLPSDLPQSTVIYVDIIPYNANGDATGCIEDTFTTSGPPVCTNLSNPLNVAVDIAIDTDLSWNAITNADGYRITVTASSSTANNGTYDVTGTILDLPNDFEQGETVTVTIVPYNTVGDASACTAESFTIRSVPNCTSLNAPSNGAIDVPLNTNITWNPVSSANGYKITVLASSSTTNNITDFDVTTGTSYNFSNDFEQGEMVTITIVPYNEIGDAIGCVSESFTIKSVPTCTNLLSPQNEGTVVSANEITWTSVDAANGYKLTITGSDSTINNETNLIVTGTNHSFANPFLQGETVTVSITPFNEIGDAVGCTTETFTIVPIPACTSLISTLNGATNVSVATDIEWNPSSYADGYRISVGTSPNGNDIVNNEDVASLTSYTLASDLPSETLIYVTITPYNMSGEHTDCISDSFETEITIPECTELSSPFNGEVDIPLESTIVWEEVENTDGYRLSIGTTPAATDILNNQDLGTETSYTHFEEFPFNTEIYVTIIPYNSVGDAIQCEEQSFTTLIPEDNTKYGFSPDGDGINEYWHIENIEYHPENVVTIYNRWGDAVFRIENYDNGSEVFRGEANLKTKMGAGTLPAGTYFFNIQIEGETILRKTKGYVVIKR